MNTSRFTSKKEAAGYLAGMIDGEGHVRHGLTQQGDRTVSRYKAIQITNTDLGLLSACQDACDALDIGWRQHEKPTGEGGVGKDGHIRKPCFVLWIMSKENLVKVRDLVPIQSAQKKEALIIAIDSYVDAVERGRRVSEGKRLANERKRKLGLPLRVDKQS